MPVIPALWMLKQEDLELKAVLGPVAKPCLNKTQSNKGILAREDIHVAGSSPLEGLGDVSTAKVLGIEQEDYTVYARNPHHTAT